MPVPNRLPSRSSAPATTALEATQLAIFRLLETIGADIAAIEADGTGSTADLAKEVTLGQLLTAVLSVIAPAGTPAVPSLNVNVVETVGGGGGGGDATAANQLTEIAVLNAILSALPGIGGGDATAANQVIEITALGNILAALGPLATETTLATVLAILDKTNTGGAASEELRANIIAPLPAGTNNIGDVDVVSLPPLPAGGNVIGAVAIDQTTPGTSNGVVNSVDLSTTSFLLTNAAVSVSSSGDNALVAAIGGQTIRIYRIVLVCEAPVAAKFVDGMAGTDLTGAMPMLAHGSIVLESATQEPLFRCSSGNAFVLNLDGAVAVTGFVQYRQT